MRDTTDTDARIWRAALNSSAYRWPATISLAAVIVILLNLVFDPGARFRRLIRVVHNNDGLVVAHNLLAGAPVLVETKSRIGLHGNVTAELRSAGGTPRRAAGRS